MDKKQNRDTSEEGYEDIVIAYVLGEARVSELAENKGVSKSAVYQMLLKLEGKGVLPSKSKVRRVRKMREEAERMEGDVREARIKECDLAQGKILEGVRKYYKQKRG